MTKFPIPEAEEIPCTFCKRMMKELLLVSENVARVYAEDGKEITREYFVAFNHLRNIIGDLR